MDFKPYNQRYKVDYRVEKASVGLAGGNSFRTISEWVLTAKFINCYVNWTIFFAYSVIVKLIEAKENGLSFAKLLFRSFVYLPRKIF